MDAVLASFQSAAGSAEPLDVGLLLQIGGGVFGSALLALVVARLLRLQKLARRFASYSPEPSVVYRIDNHAAPLRRAA